MKMRTAFFLFLLSLATAVAAEKRILHGQTVVVSSDAPWVEVNASFVGESPLGWILDGTFGTNSGKFILKNPPAEKLAEYNRLKQSRDKFASERDQAKVQLAEAKGLPNNRRTSRTRRAQIQASDTDNKIAAGELQKLEQEAKKKGYDLNSPLVVTDHAVGTSQVYQKLPVLDRGLPVK
jgi:hypothetical protein